MSKINDLKQQEKEVLKKELLEELKRDSLKNELLNELRPKGSLNQALELARHPVLLLLLGFLLTGVVGAGLTSYWENKKWSNQQRQLALIRDVEQKVKQKNEIKDDIKNAVENALGAETEILSILENDDNDKQSKELLERIKDWRNKKEKWILSSKILLQTIKTDFRNLEIQSIFEDIISMKSSIYIETTKILEHIKQNQWKLNNEDEQDARTVTNLILDARRKLSDLLSLVTSEIKDDERITIQES